MQKKEAKQKQKKKTRNEKVLKKKKLEVKLFITRTRQLTFLRRKHPSLLEGAITVSGRENPVFLKDWLNRKVL